MDSGLLDRIRCYGGGFDFEALKFSGVAAVFLPRSFHIIGFAVN